MRPYPVRFLPLCLAVLCERCAAYMLASSMVLMLCERYGYPRDEALRLAGLITAAGYLGSLPGGIVADRVLGHHRTLTGSLILLVVGYALLMIPSLLALWSSVATLVLGTSLFKPSAQAVLRRLYLPPDPRLDRAQVWLYLLINVGALSGAIIAGLAIQHWGWTFCFAITASIVCMGRACLSIGRRDVPVRTQTDKPLPKTMPTAHLFTWQRVQTIAGLTLAMLLFKVCFGQVEGALLLFTQQHTERVVHGFTVPPSWFAGLPALLVLLLAPAQLVLLPRLQRRMQTAHLVAVGLLSTSLAFLVLFPAVLPSKTHLVRMSWLVACHTLLVIGETLIGPLGLSQVLRLAPPRFVGAVIGVWFVSGAVGYWLAGEIGALWVRWSPICGLTILAVLPLVGIGVLFVEVRKTSLK